MLARVKSCGFALPLARPLRALDPVCAWQLAEGVGAGNVFFGCSPCRWQAEQGMRLWPVGLGRPRCGSLDLRGDAERALRMCASLRL